MTLLSGASTRQPLKYPAYLWLRSRTYSLPVAAIAIVDVEQSETLPPVMTASSTNPRAKIDD
jgi:hypothetical protein